jgi:hypothetical protein
MSYKSILLPLSFDKNNGIFTLDFYWTNPRKGTDKVLGFLYRLRAPSPFWNFIIFKLFSSAKSAVFVSHFGTLVE